MTNNERTYIFDAARDESELVRLRALERVFDPATRRRISATGIGEGWRCLEVGAGAGSIVTWMSEKIAPSGRVLAIDINTRFLSDLTSSNIEVRQADIRTTPIEPESMDLVHARFVLIHLSDWQAAFDAMIRCLKPEGSLVLEEPDFSSSRSFAGREELRRAFANVHRAIEAMFAARGMDYAFGVRLPALFQQYRFHEILVDNDVPIVPGGSPLAEMMGMSTRQLREKYVATGLAAETDIERYGVFTADPTCWATYHGTISAVGRKPPGPSKNTA